jgi:hypothetical protein
MKYIKTLFSFLFMSFVLMSCKTEMIDRIDIVNTEHGAYMRTISITPSNQQMSKASLGAAQVSYVIEAYDIEKGNLLDSYDLQARFVDRTPANGNNSVAYRAFLSIPASAFTRDAKTNLPRTTMVIRAADLIRTLGLTEANVSPTDQFEIDATIKLKNGKAFNSRNTGFNITGGAFYNSPFFYRITVAN